MTRLQKALLLTSLTTIAACLLGIVTIQFVVPVFANYYFSGEFRRLVVDCDLAMRDEAALRDSAPTSEAARALRISADVGLAACHDYDKLRKRMLILGVSEARLSLLGLEAMEIEQIPVERMAEPHRMERF
jgi:hypothetical protein